MQTQTELSTQSRTRRRLAVIGMSLALFGRTASLFVGGTPEPRDDRAEIEALQHVHASMTSDCGVAQLSTECHRAP